jgi:hypothetical protein
MNNGTGCVAAMEYLKVASRIFPRTVWVFWHRGSFNFSVATLLLRISTIVPKFLGRALYVFQHCDDVRGSCWVITVVLEV